MITTFSEATPSTPTASGSAKFVEQTTLREAAKDANGVVNYAMQRVTQNLAINAELSLFQRQDPTTYTTYSSTSGRVYAPDRFAFTNENASIQVKRVDTVAAAQAGLDARYYASVKKISNAGKVCVSQVFPAEMSFPLRGRSVRVRWKLANLTGSGAGTLRIGLLCLSSSGTADTIPATFISAFGATSTDPTFGTNLTLATPTLADNGTISGNGVSCTLSGAWQRFSALFTVPGGTQNIIPVLFTDGQMAINDEFGFAELIVTEGQEIRDYLPQDLQTTRQACLRYYFKTFPENTAPAQSAGLGTGELQWNNGIAGAVQNHAPGVRYPEPMRAAPTITYYNPSAANALVRDVTAAADAGTPSTQASSANGFRFDYTGNAGGIVGGISAVHLTADAEL